jgi:hypothetical protein
VDAFVCVVAFVFVCECDWCEFSMVSVGAYKAKQKERKKRKQITLSEAAGLRFADRGERCGWETLYCSGSGYIFVGPRRMHLHSGV